MKKKLFIVVLALISSLCLCIGLSACDSKDTSSAWKRVPIYQGMSIGNAVSTTSISLFAAGGNPDDSGNHYGWYKDKDKDIDQDDPFEGEDVEDAVNNSLKVEGAAQKIYYATPNEDIFITIHIDNPDNFEIMSFTLNGEKYSSYMFEVGSNMENIVLKKNVGDVSGIMEYTIDAIKYIDGTEIKDVLIDGDKTVHAGIRTNDQVTASVSETASFDEIALEISVRDRDALIAFSNGELKAVLYDGETLVAEENIAVGKSNVTFRDLKLATLYQYAVIACYDNLASGKDWHVLCKKAVYTETAVIFNDVAVTKDSVSFSLLWHDDAPETNITSLRLIDNGKERALNVSDERVEGLLSNHAYTLAATYFFKGEEIETKIDFITEANTVPTLELSIAKSGQERFDFAVDVVDPDGVGEISSIELLDGDVAQTIQDNTLRTFEGLYTNHDYVVRVTYTYDLHDGNGNQTITETATTHTLSKATPAVEVTTSDEGQESFSYTVTVTDTDAVGEITTVELLHGDDEPQILGANTSGTTEHLLSNNDYSIRVTYTYNLNDGTNELTVVKTANAHTLSKATPTVELTNIARTTSEISFEVTLTDTDSVSQFEKYELLEGTDVQATHTGVAQKAFGELKSYTCYTVKVTYSYDLNDGSSKHYITAEQSIYTMPVFGATETTCINTSAVLEGGTIVLNTALNNPCKAIVSEVKVNGIWYPVDPTTNDKNIRVQITNDGQFRGGETTLVVEKAKAKIGKEEFLFTFTSENETTCFINGEIVALSIKSVDEKGNELEYAYEGDTVYLQVTFDNPTGYKIDSITMRMNGTVVYNELEVIDVNTIRTRLSIEHNFYSIEYSLLEFTYSGEQLTEKTKSVQGVSFWFTILHGYGGKIVEIRNAEDLKHMNEDGRYKLMNDIDLKDIPWDAPGDFCGYFDGGGFTIRNMHVVDNFEKGTVDLGLFKNAKGMIKDLNIEDVLVIVTITGDSCYYGGIAAKTSCLTIESVHVSGEISITANASCEVYVGGIVADCNYSCIANCYNTSNITTSHGYAGGIAGQSYMTSTITDCYNIGKISSDSYAGGIVGYCYDTNLTNCFHIGVTSGLTPPSGPDVVITDCYHFSEGSEGTRVDSKEALIEKMKELFDENVWMFGEDGEFPTLRVFAKE